jgi:hypothetical protein
MATIDLVKKALIELKPRTGASVPAIEKWIKANSGVSPLLYVFALFLS